MHTIVTPGSGQVIRFVSAAESKIRKKASRTPPSRRRKAAKEEAKQEWNSAMKQVKAPGKIIAWSTSLSRSFPFTHSTSMPAQSTLRNSQEPLDFGSEPLTPQWLRPSAPPPDGSVVQARLLTPLSSATSQKGDEVEAIVSRPLFDGGRLIVPQGSLLKGSVLQVHPARHPGRNGELRLVFHELDAAGWGASKR